MTHRVLLLVPEGLTFDMLTPEQQDAINGVFGQYVLPMPGTLPFLNRVLCDALVNDSFDPGKLGPLGLPFDIVGMFDEAGSVLIPLNEADFMARLPEPEEGEKVLAEPHRWSGWPKCFGE